MMYDPRSSYYDQREAMYLLQGLTRNGYTVGTVGSGKSIHILSGDNPLCGSGRCTIGTRRNYRSRAMPAERVTCAKCAARLANNLNGGLATSLEALRQDAIWRAIFKAFAYEARRQTRGY